MLDRFVFSLLLIVIAWIPIPYGSNRPWAWTLMAIATFVLLALWLLGRSLNPRPLPRSLRAASPGLLFLALALAYVGAQTLAMPMPLLETLSPAAHALYSQALAEPAGGQAPLSVDAGTTTTELLKWASYLGVLLLVLALTVSRARVVALSVTLVAVGVGEALFGLYAWAFDVEFVPLALRDGLQIVGGTFVNRNHFAAHLAMVLPLAAGLMLAGHAGRPSPSRLHESERGFLAGPAPLLALAATVMLLAFVLSRSRGAALALAGALAMVLLFAWLTRGRRAPELRLLPWLGAGVVAVGIVAGGRGVFDRLLMGGFGLDERVAQWKLSLAMLADYPVFGIGAGNYVWLFPMYRDGSLRSHLLYDRAHSDYLETLIDLGVVGSALLAAGVVLLLLPIFRGYRARRDTLLRGVLFGVLVGLLALLLHAVVEFNFRIPANAAYFFVLAGLGICAATLRRAQ